MDIHDLLGKLQKIREAGPMDKHERDEEKGRKGILQAVSHAFNILDNIEDGWFETDSEEVSYEAVMHDLAELKARMEDPYELKGLKDPDDPSDRKVVTDPETGKPKWSDESVKMSHIGKDVDQTLSYDNWLKQKKGILRGARGITGPEHNKFAKEYRASKKK